MEGFVMKFTIVSLDEAVRKVSKDKQTIGFINVLIFFRKLIAKKTLAEEHLIGYLQDITKIGNGEKDKYTVEYVNRHNRKMTGLANKNNIARNDLRYFLSTLSDVIYKSRYDVVDWKILTGDELIDWEEYNDCFDESEWMQKHGLTF